MARKLPHNPLGILSDPIDWISDMLVTEEWCRVLSPREREVAALIAQGLSNKDVARKLGVSSGTVKIHVHSIFQKLGATSRYNLIGQFGSFDVA
jgi:DNA-binding NarL/FixJ family response regulator